MNLLILVLDVEIYFRLLIHTKFLFISKTYLWLYSSLKPIFYRRVYIEICVIANFTKSANNINKLQPSPRYVNVFGLLMKCAIYTPKKPNNSIYTPHIKKNVWPRPAWALGRRTPGLCLGQALLIPLIVNTQILR